MIVLVLAVRAMGGSAAPSTAASYALALGFVLLAAHISGGLARVLGLPRITGFIVAGLLLGPQGLALIGEVEVEALKLVDSVAIALIAFSAGAVLRFSEVRRRGRVVASILACEMVAVFTLVGATAFSLRHLFPMTEGRPLGEALLIAAVFGSLAITNSPSVAIAVINDMKARGPFTSTVLAVTVMKDVLVIVLFALMLSFARASFAAEGDALGFALVERLWWEVGGSIVTGALLGWMVSLYLDRWRSEPILFILGVAVVASWLANRMHLEVLLMSLTTGLFVENVAPARAEPFVRAVEANSIPFYALFFFLAGAGIHLDGLAEIWALILIIIAVRSAAIWGGTRLGSTLARADPAVRRWAWTGFVSQAGVTLGMVAITARTFPTWGPDLALVFVTMVAIHELGGPVLFQRGLVASGETAQEPPGEAEYVEASALEPIDRPVAAGAEAGFTAVFRKEE